MDLGGAQVRACESFFPCGLPIVRQARKGGEEKKRVHYRTNIHGELLRVRGNELVADAALMSFGTR